MSQRILIVDDEPFLLRNLTRTLVKATPYEIAGVASLREVREALEHFRPDLVVCDLDLGDGTGLDVLDLLRRRGLWLPFIVLSGCVDAYIGALPDDPRVIIRRKPLRASELIELVESQMALSQPTGPGTFSVSDYLQMAHFSRKSLRINARYANGATGMIDIWDGDPWRVRCGMLTGTAALSRMLSGRPLSLSTTVLLDPPVEREIDVPVSALLLELATQSDESAREAPVELDDPSPPESAEDSLIRFVAALVSGDVEKAAEHLAAARQAKPTDARLRAWWCNVVLRPWPKSEELRNGGAA